MWVKLHIIVSYTQTAHLAISIPFTYIYARYDGTILMIYQVSIISCFGQYVGFFYTR